MPFGTEKLEWRDYPTVKNFDDIFIRFDTSHERDRQTHTHKTIQDTAIVTTEDEYELVCDLSNGAISNELE